MSWLAWAGAGLSAALMGGFYYLMCLQSNSPQKQLGDTFKMPDVRLRYSPDVLYQTFASAGESGRPLMRRYWLYDYGMMAGLTGVMIAVAARIVTAGTWLFTLMLWLAVARTAVDIVEDALFLLLLRRYPAQSGGIARLASFITSLKHLLLIGWLGLLFFKLVTASFNITIA